ncbi:hypothetical protein GmHk_05G013021 [Glycine max]|nr:hypothetical protein GmHk_05G013021 [Glycine max]
MAEVQKCSLYFVYLGLAAMAVAFTGYLHDDQVESGPRKTTMVRFHVGLEESHLEREGNTN